MSSTRTALLAVVAWAGSSATFAGAQPQDRPGEAFTGTVASADAFRLVLRADNGTLVSFAIEDPAAVPAGLVPGMRITVRYEATEGEPDRLVGVRIASGPLEGGSTDPPAQRSSSASVVEQPAPPLPPETTPRAASAPPRAAVAETTQASQASAKPRAAEPAQPVEAAAGPSSQPRRTLSPTPAPREVAALAALLVVASLLLWAAYVRR
ncbi:MAG TPA: hypothetical protein VKA01_13595 [Vicinamibacteria bacterium]|nr:hypothetical protein [Vicinamibacteria bacterium]